MRDRLDDVRRRGAELVVVGNGARHFAAAFREDERLDCPVLIDPDLAAYRAAGLRRGRAELLSPRLPLHAIRALRAGYRQHAVEGDPWQLGGVFVIDPEGHLRFRHVSREAGDHPAVDDVIAALAPDADLIDERPSSSWLARIAGRAIATALDPTIVFSFDRIGFSVHALDFEPGDLDVDLTGRRCVVTGANSGIGWEAALALADLGAEVSLLCRDRTRGEAAAARIAERTGNPRVSVDTVDLADLASVAAVGRRLAGATIDVLVHNAGVLPSERIETRDGLELTFATHVAGPFLLTRLLRPALERSADARVVWVSSGGMYTRRLDLRDPEWRTRPYDGVVAYADTKRMQVILSELWAEALRGTTVVVNAMHPGWADTPSVRSSLPLFHRATRSILRTPAEGADTIVWLAAAARARAWSGAFFFDRSPRRTHYLPWTREREEDRARLWALCERVTQPHC